jgi:hypothetical protein
VDTNTPAGRALESLVGTWRGEGEGSYPDIAPFGYLEETTILASPEWGMLRVLQRTWQREGDGVRGKALHLEAGLIMRRDDGTLLYNCAQDSGRVEVMIGGVAESTPGEIVIAWETTAHANDPRLVRVGRTFWIGRETLRYEAHIATMRTPTYRRHLDARLVRVATTD